MAARVLLSAIATAGAVSVADCGSSSDHLAVISLTTDADATGGPKKGEPFTITLNGLLDEDHIHGHTVGNLHVQAVDIMDQDAPTDQKYDFYPGVPAGEVNLVFGPFAYPKTIPGKLNITGRIQTFNEREEQVYCLDFDVFIPAILDEEGHEVIEEEPLSTERQDCGDPDKDHIQNIQADITDDVATITMDLDEDISTVDLRVELAIQAPLIPPLAFKIAALPITLTPAIPAGQLKFVGYPPASETPSNDVVDIKGYMKWLDQNEEQLRCIEFGASELADSESAVSV